MAPSMELSDSLKKYGIFLRRFKTGTPARVDGKTLDYDEMTVQHGDDRIVPFSFMNELLDENRADCWLSYTNEETHEIIGKIFTVPRSSPEKLRESIAVLSFHRDKNRPFCG